MSNPLPKYAAFVDLLLKKTSEGKIPWEFDSKSSMLSLWNVDTLLTLRKSQDENFEDSYDISLFNKAGDFLEGFSDTTLLTLNVPDNEENYYIRMRELYNLGMRQATGADKALDDFISAVQSDQWEIPF